MGLLSDRVAKHPVEQKLASRLRVISADGVVRWWSLDKDDPRVGSATWEAASRVFHAQRNRDLDLWRSASLYGGLQPDLSAALGPLSLVRQRYLPANTVRPRVRLNVIRRVIDAAVAQITKADVRPLHTTTDGTWSQQRRAKLTDRFSDGQFRRNRMRTEGPACFRDACVFDMGVMKGHHYTGEPTLERTNALELGVDLRDARRGRPRMLYQRRWMDVDDLLGESPELERIIRASIGARADDDSAEASSTDQVQVIEAWRLPHKRNGVTTPGRHILCVRAGTLVDEPWTRESFPFAFLRYSAPLTGWYGTGMEFHIRGIQTEVNSTLRTIEQSLRLGANPRVLIPRGSRIVPSSINNDIMALVEYDPGGGPPIFHPGVSFPPQLTEHLAMLVQEAFDNEGVSRYAATAQKSPGVTSGVAIRTERDLGTERFQEAGKAYEQFMLDCDDLLLEDARELEAEGNKSITVIVPGKLTAQRLDWKDVALDRKEYILETFPTSSLPATPEGRLAMVQDLLEAGMLDASEGRRLLQMPDLDSVTSLENAPLDDILAEIERLLDGEDFRTPEPYQDLALGVRLFKGSYLRARHNGAPEEVMENLRLWIEQAMALLADSAPPAPTAPPATPLGVPGAPPVSPLLPTAPTPGA